jgi:acetyltransferase-like isoleucine patch superfamily enzyme
MVILLLNHCGEMIKRIIKYFAQRIYEIGRRESKKAIYQNRLRLLNDSAIIHEEAYIDNQAILQNSQNNKSKILIGKGSVVMGYLMLFKHGGEITIGDYSFVGTDTRIWSAKKIIIGNRVLIAHGVNIHDNISHPLDSLERHKDFVHIRKKGFQDKMDLREEEITIEDDAWIGFNSIILKGVRIGKGAIVGAGSLVTSNVPPFAVVAGNPIRIIKYAS